MNSTKPISRRGSHLLAVCCLIVAGCNNGNGGTSVPSSALRSEVLASLGQNVVVPAQEDFARSAASLESTLNEVAGGGASREDAQQAWRNTMALWQVLEVMQFGPAGSRGEGVMGAQSIRARIYTWPSTNFCQVDRDTAGDDYDDPDALGTARGTPVGLHAMEYLLFTEEPANTCEEFDTINEQGIWDALDDVQGRRLAHAAALGTLLRRAADDLVTVWAPGGGNFILELTDPRRSGAVYGTAQEGLNAVSDAMFYLDTESKDMKLAQAAGLADCRDEPCHFESRWAFHGRENLVANLRGFELLFLGARTGTDAPGFDDLLREMGAAELASEMQSAVTEAIVAAEAIPGTLQEAATTDLAALEAALEAFGDVTTPLKGTFLSVLELEIPDRAAGDTDS